MHQQLVVVLLVGLAVSAYGLDLSHAAAKRSTAEDARIFNHIKDLYAQAIYPPLNHIVTNLALLGAQILAGISETGLPNPNGRTDYPSEAQLRGLWDDIWNHGMKPSIENALSSVSLMAAQALAGIGVNGIDLGSLFGGLGKRDLTEAEARGFLDAFDQAVSSLFTNILQKPLETAAQNVALLAAQALAGIGVNGINLSSLFGSLGKRGLYDADARVAELRGFFDDLANGLLNGLQSVWTGVIQGPIEQALSTTALLAAQVLAGIGVNGINLGIGKRDLTAEARGPIIDSLTAHAVGLFNDQVKPMIEGSINNVILQLAGVLANFSQGGIGRR
jgi:hypothetical protein